MGGVFCVLLIFIDWWWCRFGQFNRIKITQIHNISINLIIITNQAQTNHKIFLSHARTHAFVHSNCFTHSTVLFILVPIYIFVVFVFMCSFDSLVKNYHIIRIGMGNTRLHLLLEDTHSFTHTQRFTWRRIRIKNRSTVLTTENLLCVKIQITYVCAQLMTLPWVMMIWWSHQSHSFPIDFSSLYYYPRIYYDCFGNCDSCN